MVLAHRQWRRRTSEVATRSATATIRSRDACHYCGIRGAAATGLSATITSCSRRSPGGCPVSPLLVGLAGDAMCLRDQRPTPASSTAAAECRRPRLFGAPLDTSTMRLGILFTSTASGLRAFLEASAPPRSRARKSRRSSRSADVPSALTRHALSAMNVADTSYDGLFNSNAGLGAMRLPPVILEPRRNGTGCAHYRAASLGDDIRRWV